MPLVGVNFSMAHSLEYWFIFQCFDALDVLLNAGIPESTEPTEEQKEKAALLILMYLLKGKTTVC